MDDWYKKSKKAISDFRQDASTLEWEEAEKFFGENENEVKFRKKRTKGGGNKGHSFVKINDVIYKLNNRTHTSYEPEEGIETDAGVGAFGRVKRGIDRKGNRVVVKVREKNPIQNFNTGVEEVLKEDGYLLGMAQTQPGESGRLKVQKGIMATALNVKVKEYEAIKDLGPNNLFKFKMGKTFNEKIIFALHGMMAIQSLHTRRLVHRDIKPQNFVVNQKGNHLTVLPVDFDFAIIVSDKPISLLTKVKDTFSATQIIGTQDYMSPEAEKGEYTFASDVYALGKMLEDMMVGSSSAEKKASGLLDVCAQMKAPNPENRMKLPAALEAVKYYLEHQPSNDQIRTALQTYEVFLKVETVQPVTPPPIHIPKSAPAVEKLTLLNRIGGVFGNKPTESEKKVVIEATRDKDRRHTEEIVRYLSAFKSDALPDAAKGLVSMTIDSLSAFLNDKDIKKVGAPVLETMKQFLTGLEAIDNLNRSHLDAFYMSSKKKTEQASINALKSEILIRAQKIDMNFEPPEPPIIGSKPKR